MRCCLASTSTSFSVIPNLYFWPVPKAVCRLGEPIGRFLEVTFKLEISRISSGDEENDVPAAVAAACDDDDDGDEKEEAEEEDDKDDDCCCGKFFNGGADEMRGESDDGG